MEVIGVLAEKQSSMPGDTHQNGTPCYIIADSSEVASMIMYLVLFDDVEFPVAVVDYRIKLLENPETKTIVLNKLQLDYLKQIPDIFKIYKKESVKKSKEKLEK